MKKIAITILFIILFITIFFHSSCSSEEGNINVTERPYSPIDLTLNISSMPSLGKTVELTFTVEVKDLWDSLWNGQTVDTLSNAKASVDFFWADIHGSYSEAKYFVQIPHEDVLVDGELNWEGNALENREITLQSHIRLPKEGVWEIYATFSGQDWTSMPGFTKYIAVAEGKAVSVVQSKLKSGKLAYIGYFNYGHYYPKILDEEYAPVILELDIAKAPLTGEEVLLTCRIISLNDMPDFSTHISLFKNPQMSKDIPFSSFLINGDLEWEGDLKQMTPVEFSAVIKFPEGEWRIYAEGNSLLREEMELSGFEDDIRLTVTDEKSYYGWKSASSSTGPTSSAGWSVLIGVVVFLLVFFASYYLQKKEKRNNMKVN